ncbi:MAG: CoA transferase [Micromonosporaceae bacterium]|nr:CoA transferase [Micromonosporaceae bacterium]
MESPGRQQPDRQAGGPLAGVRVIDASSFLGGPYAGMLLADLGADVVKLEAPPHGDPSRRRQDHDGYSSTFSGVNRTKRSVLINLKDRRSRPALHALVRSADVLLVSTRPKNRTKIGLDYQSVKAVNPRLVYCSITGYGETPLTSDVPAFDTTAQAMSGLLHLVMPQLPEEVSITAYLSDLLAGLYACNAVLAALVERDRSGVGQEVRTSLLEASLAFEVFNFFTLFAAQANKSTYRTVRPAGYLLRGSDGLPFAVHVPPSPEHIWRDFAAAMDLPSVRDDERFATKSARSANYPLLHRIMAGQAKTAPRAHWMKRLTERDVANAPIYQLDEVFSDPLVQDVGMLRSYPDPWGREQRTVSSGVSLSRTATVEPYRAPLAGEHNREVLLALGFSADDVDELEQAGVLSATPG